jgi:hypothetical protein
MLIRTMFGGRFEASLSFPSSTADVGEVIEPAGQMNAAMDVQLRRKSVADLVARIGRRFEGETMRLAPG